MKRKGKLIVVSGPSGAGKSSVIARVLSSRDDLKFSVSATTRAPRDGERHGVEYVFVPRDEFERMIANGELLEYAEYVGNLYGTPRSEVMERLERGISVILDIEVEGAKQVKASMPEAVLIFLAPPSLAVLESRLRGRSHMDSTLDEERLLKRLETARKECEMAHTYDYIIVNDNLSAAANELDSVITAEKCRSAGGIHALGDFFGEER